MSNDRWSEGRASGLAEAIKLIESGESLTQLYRRLGELRESASCPATTCFCGNRHPWPNTKDAGCGPANEAPSDDGAPAID